ncbi:maltose O-acetyltransferase [Microbacterium sp. SORGH_AS428]|uniref:acyltransferase n=1 Tax=Microbacterium sp. SORGH_AS_0428 TaxID=3041788 RepID=UPI00285DF6A1|nr:DapH/DapD/GlmU-related protein [Microbacterium sp. SORGH_AS_0428]MDR6200352.1 maltose O-acetyltransferase [Microbacterium sp. SORGH_AS_0428]
MNKVREQGAVWVRDVLVNGLLASGIVPRFVRWRLLRLVGVRAEKSAVCAGLWLGTRRLEIGRESFINYGCRIDNTAWVRIGPRCDLGPQVSILTTTHLMDDQTRRAGAEKHMSVSIGAGVWIGARATLLPGVTVGDGAVIAAGALVTRDCEPHTLYAGVPARAVRTLSRTDSA